MSPSELTARRETAAERVPEGRRTDPLAGRLGLSVPHEWWPSAPLLKSYEAAGFGWVQLHSPPPSVLLDPRTARRHATALGASLATTSLDAVIHAPPSLRLGSRSANDAFEGLVSYAAEVGASQIVLHALALADEPASRRALNLETRSLAGMARIAERLGITIALENLAPLYPGPETLAANPSTVRTLVRTIGSDRVRMCLDLGHAHIVADGLRTRVETLCEPVLDVVSVIHLHDNLGARREPAKQKLGVDPLRLDLHLPPGRGTVPWHRIAPLVASHPAPVLLEVHPPYRPRSADLARATTRLLA